MTSERLLNFLYLPEKLLYLPKQISGYPPALHQYRAKYNNPLCASDINL